MGCDFQTVADAPFKHRAAAVSLGWNWLSMLLVAALALGVQRGKHRHWDSYLVANRGMHPTAIQSTTALRRHSRRSRVSTVGIAPMRVALLVLSTLATTVADHQHQASPSSSPPPLVLSFTGQCVVRGDCVCSSNYPAASGDAACTATNTTADSQYSNSELCLVVFSQPVELQSHMFDTEVGYDMVTVDGQDFEGDVGPEGVLASALRWSSDGSITRGGFKICFGRVSPPSTPPPSPPLPSPPLAYTVAATISIDQDVLSASQPVENRLTTLCLTVRLLRKLGWALRRALSPGPSSQS